MLAGHRDTADIIEEIGRQEGESGSSGRLADLLVKQQLGPDDRGHVAICERQTASRNDPQPRKSGDGVCTSFCLILPYCSIRSSALHV